MLQTMPKVGAPVPAWPIARPTMPLPTADELRQMELDSLDTLIDDYAAAMAERDDAARRVDILKLRIDICRLSLAGQTTLEVS